MGRMVNDTRIKSIYTVINRRAENQEERKDVS